MKLLVIFLLTMASFSFAGNEIGNGGNSVHDVCLQKIKFYDAYEMEKLYGWEIDVPEAAADEIAIALGFANRLESFDSPISNYLHSWITSFYKDTDFQNEPLVMLSDFKSRVIEDGSEFHQLIIQKNGRYRIDRTIWEKMDRVQKAVAILHEVIYRRSLLHNPYLNKSDAIRTLVQNLIANKAQDNWITVTLIIDMIIQQRPVLTPSYDLLTDRPVVRRIKRKHCENLQN